MLLDLIGRKGDFPRVRRPELVTAVRWMHVPYASLAPLQAFTNLRELSIIDLRADDLSPLRACTHLRYLRICHLPRVQTLEALAGHPSLQTLSLAVLPSAVSGRRWRVVDNLEPVARLPALRHLDLLGVVPLDRQLRPLEGSRTLRTALFMGYPATEEARFYAATDVGRRRTPPAAGFPEGNWPSRPFPGAERLRRWVLEGR